MRIVRHLSAGVVSFSREGNLSSQLRHLTTNVTSAGGVSFIREGNLSSPIVLVAIHGGPGSHRDFRHIASEFNSKKGGIAFEFVRCDLSGYGDSEPLPLSLAPTAINYAHALFEALDAAKILQPNRSVVFMGHSLGGHIAMELASLSTAPVAGIALIAPACMRPHRMIGNESLYWLNVWMGNNSLHPLFGPAISSLLDYVYKHVAGFSKNTRLEEIIVTQRRVALLDFKRFSAQAKSLQCPVFYAYAENDKLIQKTRFEELASVLQPLGGRRLVYTSGGHNIQKTKCTELANEISDWISHHCIRYMRIHDRM